MPKKETMTPRERVNKALNHEIPDRVPIDLGGNQTGIHKNAYRLLIKHLGIADEIRIMDAVQQLATPCEQVLQRFHVDTRYIAAGAAASWKGGIVKARRDGRNWDDLTDEFGIRWPTRPWRRSGITPGPKGMTPAGLPACASGR